jgi:hypothetical protein
MKILKIFVFLGLIFSFFAMRAPLFQKNLSGEDGMFANIFINQPAGPNYLQVARLDGQEIYFPPQHPAFLYETIRIAGRIAGIFINLHNLSDYKATVLLRFSFSLFSLLIWMLYALISLLAEKNDKKSLLMLISLWVLCAAPLSVGTSLQLQTDTTAGILFVGLFSAMLLLNHFNRLRGRLFLAGVFTTAMLIGLGKNEWSIIFLSSLIVTFLFRFLLLKKLMNSSIVDDGQIFPAALFGCLAGNLFSFLFDPYNYLEGFNIIGNRLGTFSAFGNQGSSWYSVFLWRLPVLFVILLLLLYSSIFIVVNLRKVSLVQSLSYFFSAALFMTFLPSTQSVFDRYFAPAFVSSVATFLLLFPTVEGVRSKSLFAAICAGMLIYSWMFYPPVQPYQNIQAHGKTGCAEPLSVADGYNKDFDYVANPSAYINRDGYWQSVHADFREPVCTDQ